MHNKREIIKNIGFSFVAYALPASTLQFIVQPIIANRLGAEANGQYLTLMSLTYFVITITASVLNTVRLLQDKKYNDNRLQGDFNILLLFDAIIVVIILPCGLLFYTKTITITDSLLFATIGLLYLYHDYIFAQYRLRLQYNKILINNTIAVLGYFIGIALFIFTGKWQIVLICVYSLTAIYDYFNTDFLKEPLLKTPLFKETLLLTLTLTASNILTSSVSYFDKLLLYPLLGGKSVSIYYSASIIGKMLLLISTPLSSVLLSYLVKEDKLQISFKAKQYVFLICLLVVLYFVCIVIGYPLTLFLYPKWAKESLSLVPITVAASLFMLLGNCINTILIRFFKSSLQLVVNATHLIIYLFLSLIGLTHWGLLGFCFGVAISNVLRLTIVITVALYQPKGLLK